MGIFVKFLFTAHAGSIALTLQLCQESWAPHAGMGSDGQIIPPQPLSGGGQHNTQHCGGSSSQLQS